MKRLIIPGVFLLLLSLTWVALARLTVVSEQRHAVGRGGVTEGGGYRLSSISAQPIAGRQSGADYNLIWGFWQPPQGGETYLPMIFNNYCPGFIGPHEGEPNDSTALANGPLCFGHEYTGSPDDNGADQDSDYFYIQVGPNHTIHVRISEFLPANAQVQLYYETVGQLVAFDVADGDGNYVIDYPGTAGGGKYYIRVVAAAGHVVGNGNYKLIVTVSRN